MLQIEDRSLIHTDSYATHHISPHLTNNVYTLSSSRHAWWGGHKGKVGIRSSSSGSGGLGIGDNSDVTGGDTKRHDEREGDTRRHEETLIRRHEETWGQRRHKETHGDIEGDKGDTKET